MKTGRKPVPTVLKRLHGYPGHHTRTGAELEGVGELLAPPEWFDAEQCEQWDYALENAPPGLLTATDREILAGWCCAAVEYARAVTEVRKLGQVVKTKEGNAIQNPFLPIMNRQFLIMLRAGAELGFSPAARASLGASITSEQAEDEDGLSALDKYLAEKPDRLS